MNNTIGNNIRKYREKKGWTQVDFAKQINCDRSTISNWETGRRKPDLDCVEKIAGIFGIELGQLLLESEELMQIENDMNMLRICGAVDENNYDNIMKDFYELEVYANSDERRKIDVYYDLFREAMNNSEFLDAELYAREMLIRGDYEGLEYMCAAAKEQLKENTAIGYDEFGREYIYQNWGNQEYIAYCRKVMDYAQATIDILDFLDKFM